MSVAALLPRAAVFAVSSVGSAAVAFVLLSPGSRPPLIPEAGNAPDYVLAGASNGATLAAFDLVDAERTATVIDGLSEADLETVTDALIDDTPPPGTTPLGFPRVKPVSQFDGGHFQKANCTLAAGAMLAQLRYGIVTTGTILRQHQYDQEGGTDLNDLQTAMYRAYGVKFDAGSITVKHLRSLLAAGYGAVLQGVYGQIPAPIRLQPGFTGGHAIYIDGFYPGRNGKPAAYYVIDPIGTGPRYKGEWWPAPIVDSFARAFGRGGRVTAAWAYPPGGTSPEIQDIDVRPIPTPPGGISTPTRPPTGGSPSATIDTPSGSASGPSSGAASGIASGLPDSQPPESQPPDIKPGDNTPDPGPQTLPLSGPAKVGDLDLIAALTYCIRATPGAGCPVGVEGVFASTVQALGVAAGPTITIRFVDSDRPNVALVGFSTDPPGPVDLRYWKAQAPETSSGPTSMAEIELNGSPVVVAALAVDAATTYHFQVVAGDGILASSSPVGTFTTGGGVTTFRAALEEVAARRFGTEESNSPFVHVADGAVVPALVEVTADTPKGTCGRAYLFAGVRYCAPREPDLEAPCNRVTIDYGLAGLDPGGVVVRAYPVDPVKSTRGIAIMAGILESDASTGSGTATIGCLASGLSYSIVLDATGADGGILASTKVVVP